MILYVHVLHNYNSDINYKMLRQGLFCFLLPTVPRVLCFASLFQGLRSGLGCLPLYQTTEPFLLTWRWEKQQRHWG